MTNDDKNALELSSEKTVDSKDTFVLDTMPKPELSFPLPEGFTPYTITMGDIYGGPDNQDPVNFPKGRYNKFLSMSNLERKGFDPKFLTNENLAKFNIKTLIADYGVTPQLAELLGEDNIPADIDMKVVSSDANVRGEAVSQILNAFNQKGFSNEDIIYSLTNVEPESFFTGIKRELLPVTGGSVGATATGLAASATGMAALPVVATSIVGGIGFYSLLDILMEDEVPLPGDQAGYESGRTFTGLVAGPVATYSYIAQRRVKEAFKEAKENLIRNDVSGFLTALYKGGRNKADVIVPINQPASELVSGVTIRNQKRLLEQKAAQNQLTTLNKMAQERRDQGVEVPQQLQDRIAAMEELLKPIKKEVASRYTRINAFIERLMGRNLSDAQLNKRSFLGQELLAGTGAAGGAFLAMESDPNALVSRFLFEMGGGLAAPTVASTAAKLQYTLPAVKSLFPGKNVLIDENWLQGIKRRFGEEMEKKFGQDPLKRGSSALERRKQRAAVKEIMNYLVEGGSDVEAIVKKLTEAQNVEGLNVIALLDDPNIQAINAAILNDVDKLDKSLAESHLESRAILRAKLFQLAGILETGELTTADRNAAVKMMYELEKQMFENDLQVSFDEKVERVARAAEATLKRDPETGRADISGGDFDVTAFSEQLFNAVDRFIQTSRGRQSILYEAVPNSEIVRNVGPEGQELDMPYFIKVFFQEDMFNPAAVEFAEKYMKEFPELTQFVNRYAPSELKDLADVKVADQVASEVKNSPVIKRLRKELVGRTEMAEASQYIDLNAVPEDLKELYKLRDSLFEIEIPVGRGVSEELIESRQRIDKSNALKYIEAKIKLAEAEKNAGLAARSKLRKTAVTVTPEVEGKPLDIKQLRTVRGDLLSTARTARAAGDFAKARRAEKMAAAIEVTMNGIDTSKTDVVQKLNLANSYTRAFYDVFERSFVGNMTAESARYGDKMLPEDFASRVFSGSNSRSLRRFDEIRETVKFLENQSSALSPEQIKQLQEQDFGSFV
ncbi:MAG TPA: hypothetical protein DEB18_02875, partial [Leeuwenhoekiella sp.]|nr:hypothetical protein [Leeuwenhoekiella sp.]